MSDAATITLIREWLGEAKPPKEYWSFLVALPTDAPIGMGGLLYSASSLLERNETFEVQKYCPGYLNVGDDGGGRAIVLKLDAGSLWIVDHGSMTPDCMEEVAPTFRAWQEAGFPIPGEDDTEYDVD